MSVQQRSKWKTRGRNFQIDDAVIIINLTLLSSNGTWPLGRIILVSTGKDGLVREATLKTVIGEHKRHVTRLTLLPISSESPERATSKPTGDHQRTSNGVLTFLRQAGECSNTLSIRTVAGFLFFGRFSFKERPNLNLVMLQ